MAEIEPPHERIDLNRADVETLAKLPGIGPVLAARIAAYRDQVGPFKDVAELTAVSGIAASTVADIGDRLTVESQPDAGVEPAPEEEAEGDEAPAAGPLVQAAMAVAQENGGGEPDQAGEIPAQASEEIVSEAPENGPEVAAEAADLERIAAPEGEPVEEAEAIDSQGSGRQELGRQESAQQALREPESEVEKDGGQEASMEEVPIRFLTQEGQATPVGEEPADVGGTVPAAAAATSAPASSRAGCSLLAVLLGAIVGMFLGALLALAILAGLNGGSLRFASSNFAREVEQELLGRVDEAQRTQEELSRQLAALETEVNGLGNDVAALGDEQASVSQDVDEVQGQVAGLTGTVESVQERVANLAAAAENFTTFLNGLRDLVVELEGTPTPSEPGASPSPRETVSPTSTTTSAATPSATGTGTPRPTRTPRPTATPFSVQTATPGR